MFDDFENEDDGGLSGYFQRMKEAQRHMFMTDVRRYTYNEIPLTPEEYKEAFGDEPDDECYQIMTQRLLKDWHIFGEHEIGIVIDKWGCDWLGNVLKYNVEVEEYELCSIIKTIIDCSNQYLEEMR